MNATRPLTATWMLAHAGFTGARKTSAAHAFSTAAQPARRRPIRTANTMQAAASPVKATVAAMMWAMPCQDIAGAGPSGVPIGNPFSGSITNTPEATSPRPKTAISGANQRRPTPVGDGAPDGDSQTQHSNASEYEVGYLNKTGTASGEQAKRVPSQVEAVAKQYLAGGQHGEQWSGDGAGDQ